MVRKTQSKTLHFAAASIRLREVQRVCPACGRVWRNPDYGRFAPPRSNVTWSLTVWIGQERFHRHRQVEEVRAALANRGVHLAASTVVRAADAYLARYAALHADPELWRALRMRDQPLVWDVDGTTENGGGSVLVVRMGPYTVHADGVASEAEPHVVPVLEEAQRRTGNPAAVRRDGSDGLRTGLGKVVPDASQLGCHYHVLRNAGARALEEAHVDLARTLSTDHVRARLSEVARGADAEWSPRLRAAVDWILEAPGGLAFPFRRPALELLDRIDEATVWVHRVLKAGANANRSLPDVTAFKQVLDRYQPCRDEDRPLARRVRRAAGILRRVAPWFDRVRQALDAFRQSPQDPDEDGARALRALDDVEREARDLGGPEGDVGVRLVKDVRDVWTDIVAPVRHQGALVTVERTIASTERSHRAWKRGVRRRTGRGRVAGALRHHGTALALVGNWDQAAFRAAMGGHAGLVRRIGGLDAVHVEAARQVLVRLRPAAGRRRHKGGGQRLPGIESVTGFSPAMLAGSRAAVQEANG